MGRKLSFVVAGIILVVCVSVAAILIVTRPETARQEPPPHTPYVTTATVMTGEGAIPIYGAGTVQPHTGVHVTTEVHGRIVWVNPAFQSGGCVSSGEILFRIDDAEYLSRVDRARTSVAAQEVELMRTTAESRIAKEQFDKWEQEGNSSRPTPLALWEPQIAAAQAALDRDQSELAEAELRLSRITIYSPFSAVVVSESVTMGQFVATGQNVGHLYGTELVAVSVPLPDESAALIPELWSLKPGTDNRNIPARVTARYGDQQYSWTGTVDRVEAALESQTRTIEVIIHVRNPFTSGIALNAEPRSGNIPRC